MFSVISDIIVIIFLSISTMYFLDYIFGTDKLKFINAYLIKTQPFSFLFLTLLIIGSVVKIIAWAFDSEVADGLGTFYVSSIYISMLMYYSTYGIITGIVSLRNANINRRKKPH